MLNKRACGNDKSTVRNFILKVSSSNEIDVSSAAPYWSWWIALDPSTVILRQGDILGIVLLKSESVVVNIRCDGSKSACDDDSQQISIFVPKADLDRKTVYLDESLDYRSYPW